MLKETLVDSNSDVFKDLLDRYMLNNTHKLTFVMRPDEKYSESLNREEQVRLKEKLSLSNTDKIYESGLELAKLQAHKQG